MRLMRLGFAGFLGGYGAGVVALWLGQRSLLYTPDNAEPVLPSVYATLAGVEQIALQTADGLDLSAWYAPAPVGRPTVVLFPGKAGSLRSHRYRLKGFKDAGMGVLLVAYRGYSGNAGRPTEQGLYTDARAALDWLAARGVRGESLTLYGASLGTGVAVAMAAERDVGAVVLESPYTSTVDVAAERFPFVPVQWLMADRFESVARIGAVAEPLLVMHGGRDTVVPQALGRRMFAAARSPKEGFWPPAVGHNDLFDNGGLTRALDFIERQWVAPGGWAPPTEAAYPSTAAAHRATISYR